ncbi:MAG: SUMF1/EgtB/PvdO family nonheme iron enzyme [Deltaproteobacteria bacterium]|nr:SUMF1/EgtB/PvdO family nonheme iron enzyme [Deltaproteobacteria bacterium]
MPKVFISYRREDAAGYAQAIYGELERHLGRDQIFMDVDTVEAGVDFVTRIEQAVSECDVVIALIGNRWMGEREDGPPRIHDPQDFVHLEIAIALSRDIRVIPVLVDGASMPAKDGLPPSLQQLIRRNALELSNTRFRFDLGRVSQAVHQTLVPPSVPKPVNWRWRPWMRFGSLAIFLVTLGIAAGVWFKDGEEQPIAKKQVEDPPPAQQVDVSRARGSVVRVIAEGGNSIGSGAIVKVQGTTAYVLTAYHVIRYDVENGVNFVEVELFTEEKLRARISQRRIDVLNDIAVLTIDKLPAKVPPEIPWGYSAELRDLDKIYAVGHAGREVGWYVTDGTISRIQGGKIYFSGTAVSSGNSGGPLLNEQGALVGMNLRLGSQGLAIREDIARAIVDRWVPSLPSRVAKREPALPEKPEKPEPVVPTKPPTPTLTAGKVFRDRLKMGGEGPEMGVIPAGSLWMGSPDNEPSRNEDEGPQRTVTLRKAFALGRYEITVGEFRAFIDATEYKTEAEEGTGCQIWTGKEWKYDNAKYWKNPGFAQTDRHPVVCVSWNDAYRYLNWLKSQTGKPYRLPSEAEWEYATRGGTLTSRYWGNEADRACQHANVADRTLKRKFPNSTVTVHNCEDGHVYTAPVGSYLQNRFGLKDTLGNVWEWVEDCWHKTYNGAPTDGSAWLEANGVACGLRVIRGGSWSNEPQVLRTSIRHRIFDVTRVSTLGFRLAQDIP